MTVPKTCERKLMTVELPAEAIANCLKVILHRPKSVLDPIGSR
ncbi:MULTISPECIES: hypothetical protein [Kamptonema]|nr:MULTISPECIES: hypothetical protein [Kamptonema]CBN54205.1 hypothetical protein OSCI_660003 [Kamptonema sp. PCC 6506]